MPRYIERSTFHTGKRQKGSGKAYEADHNTNEKGRALQSHIDPEKFQENVYYYYDMGQDKMVRVQGGEGGFSSKKIERDYAKKQFQEGLDCINERYVKSGHPEDKKTLNQMIQSKPPMEIMTELGGVNCGIPLQLRGEILQGATVRTWERAQAAFGNNMRVLDQAFHADEGLVDGISMSNHMHTRVWFFVNGKDGHPVINQNEALKEMGFGVPKYVKGMTAEQMKAAVQDPNNWGEHAKKTALYKFAQEYPEIIKHTKAFNSTVAFTDMMRETFNRYLELAAKERGIDLTIEREAANASYRQAIKRGDITREDLAKDVLSDPERARTYKTADQYKAAQEEKRAREAQEAARTAQKERDEALAAKQSLEAENDALRRQLEELKAKERSKTKSVQTLSEQETALENSTQSLQVQQSQLQKSIADLTEVQAVKDELLEIGSGAVRMLKEGRSPKRLRETPAQEKTLFKSAKPGEITYTEEVAKTMEAASMGGVAGNTLAHGLSQYDKKLKETQVYLNSQEKDKEIEELKRQLAEKDRELARCAGREEIATRLLHKQGMDSQNIERCMQMGASYGEVMRDVKNGTRLMNDCIIEAHLSGNSDLVQALIIEKQQHPIKYKALDAVNLAKHIKSGDFWGAVKDRNTNLVQVNKIAELHKALDGAIIARTDWKMQNMLDALAREVDKQKMAGAPLLVSEIVNAAKQAAGPQKTQFRTPTQGHDGHDRDERE